MSLRHRWRYSPARTRFSNWRNQNARERGRRDIPARAGGQIRSRTPVYRDRINPGTGRPHREDARLGRVQDQGLRRHRDSLPIRTRDGWRFPEQTGRQRGRGSR